MSYEDALPSFRVGMTMSEVKKAFGEPFYMQDVGSEIVWDYTPADRLKPPVSEVHGFDIYFQKGAAKRIVQNTLTSS